VEKATGGSLKIVVRPGGEMIKHAEIKRAVSDGKAAAGEVLISLAADEAPVYGVDSIPFLATGYDGARKLYEAQKPYLKKIACERRTGTSVFGSVAAAGRLRETSNSIDRGSARAEIPHLQRNDQAGCRTGRCAAYAN
jgi:TRAP-type C4-dicarboxylate transport system substrate-binding protein